MITIKWYPEGLALWFLVYEVRGGLPAVGRGLCPPELCPRQIKKYEKLDSEEERTVRSRHIFDHYIMKELLACSHVSAVLCQGGVPRACGRDVPSVPR